MLEGLSRRRKEIEGSLGRKCEWLVGQDEDG